MAGYLGRLVARANGPVAVPRSAAPVHDPFDDEGGVEAALPAARFSGRDDGGRDRHGFGHDPFEGDERSRRLPSRSASAPVDVGTAELGTAELAAAERRALELAAARLGAAERAGAEFERSRRHAGFREGQTIVPASPLPPPTLGYGPFGLQRSPITEVDAPPRNAQPNRDGDPGSTEPTVARREPIDAALLVRAEAPPLPLPAISPAPAPMRAPNVAGPAELRPAPAEPAAAPALAPVPSLSIGRLVVEVIAPPPAPTEPPVVIVRDAPEPAAAAFPVRGFGLGQG